MSWLVVWSCRLLPSREDLMKGAIWAVCLSCFQQVLIQVNNKIKYGRLLWAGLEFMDSTGSSSSSMLWLLEIHSSVWLLHQRGPAEEHRHTVWIHANTHMHSVYTTHTHTHTHTDTHLYCELHPDSSKRWKLVNVCSLDQVSVNWTQK